jgi:hypothetical protein
LDEASLAHEQDGREHGYKLKESFHMIIAIVLRIHESITKLRIQPDETLFVNS